MESNRRAGEGLADAPRVPGRDEGEVLRAVEEIMERKVVAFMSQVHFEPDMAAEIFVLAPEAADAAPEA